MCQAAMHRGFPVSSSVRNRLRVHLALVRELQQRGGRQAVGGVQDVVQGALEVPRHVGEPAEVRRVLQGAPGFPRVRLAWLRPADARNMAMCTLYRNRFLPGEAEAEAEAEPRVSTDPGFLPGKAEADLGSRRIRVSGFPSRPSCTSCLNRSGRTAASE